MLRNSVVVATLVLSNAFGAGTIPLHDTVDVRGVSIATRRADGCQVKIIGSNAKGTDVAMESLSSVSRSGRTTNWNDGPLLYGNDMMQYRHDQTDIEFLVASSSACERENRFRFVLRRGNTKRTVFFPNATEYTSAKTINIGDVARHF